MNGIKRWGKDNSSGILLVVIIFMIMVFLSFETNAFFSGKNFVNILEATSYRLLLALGMMCVIATGAIDLSVGSVLSLSAIIMAKALKAGLPTPICILIALGSGIVMGIITGSLVHYTRINALIITLATSFMYRGISLIITKGTPVSNLPKSFRDFGYGDIFGMESGVTFGIITIIILYFFMKKMKWGHYLMGIGGNESALRRMGVKIGFYRISAFAFVGMMAAMAGIIISARLNSAEANAGLNMEMDAICAVIMGGSALHGGKVSYAGTIIAVFLLGLIRNGLTIMSVSSYYQQFITGMLLLIAVVIAELRERKNR